MYGDYSRSSPNTCGFLKLAKYKKRSVATPHWQIQQSTVFNDDGAGAAGSQDAKRACPSLLKDKKRKAETESRNLLGDH